MTDRIEQVERLEAARWQANIAGDIETLNSMLSEQVEYVHPTGKLDTKESFLNGLTERNPYLGYEVVSKSVVELGDAVVITTAFNVIARRDPPQNSELVKMRNIAVWAQEDGKWQLVRYQVTFMP